MYAFAGILAALYERERTGAGPTWRSPVRRARRVDGLPALLRRLRRHPAGRAGTHHAAIAPYGTFAAGDGTEVVLAIQNEREWAQFCAVVLERPDLATDQRFDSGARRVAHRPDLHAEIEAVVRRAHRRRGHRAAGRSAHRPRPAPGAGRRPRAPAARRPRPVDEGRLAGRPAARPAPPIDLPGARRGWTRSPRVGQHTDEILRELGGDRSGRDAGPDRSGHDASAAARTGSRRDRSALPRGGRPAPDQGGR